MTVIRRSASSSGIEVHIALSSPATVSFQLSSSRSACAVLAGSESARRMAAVNRKRLRLLSVLPVVPAGVWVLRGPARGSACSAAIARSILFLSSMSRSKYVVYGPEKVLYCIVGLLCQDRGLRLGKELSLPRLASHYGGSILH